MDVLKTTELYTWKHSRWQEKKKKSIQIAKIVKLSQFEYNTVLYTENLDSKKTEQINKFSNAVEYKIKTQKIN